ncbi:hypothetical protein HanRHA438_Chr03g0106661 [Helianthus annuus]|nr:hypothetical protein HanHA300_Chr03g0079821 [Helianthus annuus]KAJ0599392.1 hypothetical protein HanIR_Chr03g0104341 [Helianthus annuus]KAJ0606984.1 hypothetical protein HanHA89_Chr03g0091271 [Helianthus annuus]KAJ0767041.1 hypothetical protein HanLR1_Chr03g0084501 [Helianthus annuus]KAJ0772893.1 hypothetical protein HanOQP8_Chr03g0092631 [Helianthus annuus]
MQLGFRWRRWKEPRLHTTKMEMESFYGRFRPDLRRCQLLESDTTLTRRLKQLVCLRVLL